MRNVYGFCSYFLSCAMLIVLQVNYVHMKGMYSYHACKVYLIAMALDAEDNAHSNVI